MFEELQEVIRGEDAQKSGVRYLEYESLEVEVRGKVWKVFGSPVCSVTSGVGLVRVDPHTRQAAARYSFGAFQYENEGEAAGACLIP